MEKENYQIRLDNTVRRIEIALNRAIIYLLKDPESEPSKPQFVRAMRSLNELQGQELTEKNREELFDIQNKAIDVFYEYDSMLCKELFAYYWNAIAERYASIHEDKITRSELKQLIPKGVNPLINLEPFEVNKTFESQRGLSDLILMFSIFGGIDGDEPDTGTQYQSRGPS